jgi:hypothetical protein
MIRPHVAFGAGCRIADYFQIREVIGMTGSAGAFDTMAIIAANFPHFCTLLEKAGTLDRRKGLGAGGIMAESALPLVSSGEIAGAAPARVEPHPVPTATMGVKSLFVTGSAGVHINPRLPLDHLFVIGSVTFLATDAGLRMGTPFPLPHRLRGLYAMTGNALFSLQISREEEDRCRNHTH